MHGPRSALVVCVAWLCIATGPLSKSLPASTSLPQAPPTTMSIDIVALDRDGRPVDTLGPADFTMTIDGRPRPITSVRHVSRGPGASDAAAQVAAAARSGVVAAAETARTVLLVVDETMMERGDEASTVRTATTVLDRLGLADRVAIVRVPMRDDRRAITLTTDRPSARDDLREVVGQISLRAAADPAAVNEPARVEADPARAAASGGDPDKAAGEREQVQQEQAFGLQGNRSLSPESIGAIRASLGGLRDVLASLGPLPGRKAVVLFTAGLPRGWAEVVREADMRSLAAAAAAARTTVHVFGLRTARADAQAAPEPSALEGLARMTGGSYSAIDKQVDRAIDRVMASMSTCYVLSWDGLPGDADGRAHVLRVDARRRDLTVQGPAVLVKSNDPQDPIVDAPSAHEPEARADSPGAPPAPPVSATGGRDAETREQRERALTLVLGRAIDYVAGYQQAFSAVVAEETYLQTAGARRVAMVSDFLLVRPQNGTGWVSFRDVFEVNGDKVRDRDDRLKALFLAGGNLGESDQMQAIKAESTRYNIGPIERTLNVPLYPLQVLTPETRGRFRFTLGKTGQSGGVPVQRIGFEEIGRPTLTEDGITHADVPLRGSFAIDPLTGAITESELEALNAQFTARFVVRYRRDGALGLWVPQEMLETYVSTSGSRLMEAQAFYSKLRRFQVKTEEKLANPK